MDIEKVVEALDSEEFKAAVEGIETIEGLMAYLHSHDVECSAEEVEELLEEIAAAGELSEDELDKAAGGLAVRIGRRVATSPLGWPWLTRFINNKQKGKKR